MYIGRNKYFATRAQNVLKQPYGSPSVLQIFCPSCSKMGDVKKVLLGECCADKDTQKVTPQKERGVEKKKRRQEEMLTQEVFFPKQSEARYNPNRIIDLARPNANNQAAKRESTGRAKTELDWQIYRASQTPAPGDHTLPSTFSKLGAKISKGSFKTELGIHRLHCKSPSKICLCFRPPLFVDWIQTNGPKVPGPGTASLFLCFGTRN
jgi:hypothetical protein